MEIRIDKELPYDYDMECHAYKADSGIMYVSQELYDFIEKRNEQIKILSQELAEAHLSLVLASRMLEREGSGT